MDVMFNTFQLSIELGNDAMRAGPDVARALRQVADKIENDLEARGSIRDENGNTVGSFEAVNRDADESCRACAGSQSLVPVTHVHTCQDASTA